MSVVTLLAPSEETRLVLVYRKRRVPLNFDAGW